ncbi:MAG TPA: aminopeptidase, partial [Steroidobacteraceae bacterium]|nr:aminopeptidase [Steroidobacteraceae bacterium]
ARYKTRRQHQRQYLALFTRTRAQLADLYAQQIPREEMRARKADIFSKLADEIRALDKKLGGHSGYDDWIEEGLNNAHLASVATYYDCVPGFTRLLALHNGNLPAFYAAVRDLAKKPRAERHALLCTSPETEDSAPVPSEPAPSSSAAAN